ncbi:MAG: hypothetical protein EBY86_04060 [Acidimicrobiia bacterium]|nr:hypothetical protein [Acidimicrobiia bacterium]
MQNALVPGRGQVMFELEKTTICGKSVGWNKYLYGYADNMADIPWKGFFSFLTPAEVKGRKIRVSPAPSSPGPTPNAVSASHRASVPLPTPTALDLNV